MRSKEIYSGLDPVLKEQADNVWRVCLLLTRDGAAADELCFQSFLRLAARRPEDTREDRVLLYASACRLCQDWFSRKLRKRQPAEAVRQRFGCQPGDALELLLRKPFPDRMAAGLRMAELTDEEIRKVRGKRMQRKASRVSEAAPTQLRSVSPPADYAEQLSDRVYDRFSERSVGLENTLQAIRMGFADAAPWLALLVLLFFGFSLWYVQNH